MNAKVLIVEDEISLARSLLDRLQKEGYEVEIASDGNLGMELLTRDSFDLLIVDLVLPRQNGLCRKLRNLGSTIPILILKKLRRCRLPLC
jgi:DNA-binding response OmpR family regulator